MFRGFTFRRGAARCALTVGGLLAAACIPASIATAAPGTVLAVNAEVEAITDGHETVAIALDTGVYRFVSDGRRRDVARPDDCWGQLQGVGAGRALLGCWPGPRLIDVASGQVEQPPAFASWTAPAGQTFAGWEGIGAAAIGARLKQQDGTIDRIAVDRRSGAVLGGPPADDEVLDLDSPRGVTKLCAPLKVSSGRWNDKPERLPYAYDPPYGAGLTAALDRLVVQRCGSGPIATLPVRDLSPVSVSNGTVLAETERGQFAYVIGCQLKLDWNTLEQQPRVALLDDALVVSSVAGYDGRTLVRRVPLERPCARATEAGGVSATARGRTVRAAERSLVFADAATGTTATRSGGLRERAPRLVVGPAGALALRTGRAVSSLGWRLGDGGWHRASGSGRRWRLALPRLRGERPLTLRFADGERLAGSAAVRVRQARR